MYVKFDKGAKYSSVKNPEDREVSESLDGFDDAGYILTDKDLVVDVDDLDIAVIEKLIKIFGIKTQIVWTDRGAHFYYKKPAGFKRARGVTPLGFKVEYKRKPQTYATTIKRNGVKRTVVNEGVRDELPQFLKPGKYKVLLGLDEGDGRNNELYAHKIKINKLKDCNKILRFINEYIFSVPLEEKEFETLARDEDVHTQGNEDEYVAATTIINEINPILYNQRLYFYHGNHYINNEDQLRRVVMNMFPGFKTRFTDEVIKQINYRCTMTPDFPVFDIKLKNGYLHDGKFIEEDYTDFTPYYIDIKYDPNTKPVAIVDEYLDNLSGGDEDYKRFITDIFGHCLITDPDVKRSISKFFMFIGNGGEGKGTFLDIVRKILGENNCSSVSIDNIGEEKYFSTIDAKLANLGDDQLNAPINGKQMKNIKNLATADTVALRNLYENPRAAKPIATLIFTTNYELKSYDKDESYKRRVVWCPMFTKPKERNKDFIKLVTTPECLQYWIKLAVEGYERIYENNGMDIPDVVRNYTKHYHEDNDNMGLYVDSLSVEEIEGRTSKQLYDEYTMWADENGETPLSSKHMIKTIRELKGYDIKVKRVNGTPKRVFEKMEN